MRILRFNFLILLVLFAKGAGAQSAIFHDDSLHNCRMWGMLTAGTFNDTSKIWHLHSLKQLSPANPNGWGLGFYTQTMRGGNIPVIFRGMWRADQDFLYDSCAAMMIENLSTSAIAHVRRSSSGYVNIPDPHPFYTKSLTRNFSMMFAHNGTLNKPTLITLLETYAAINHYNYSGDGVNDPNHDTDLYRLYLMKWIDEHPEDNITTCLSDAIVALTTQMGTNLSYNFIMISSGDTLWALRYNNTLSYRRETGPSGYVWEVASEPLTSPDWVKATNYFLYKFTSQKATPDSIPVKDLGFAIAENSDPLSEISISFQNPASGNQIDLTIESKKKSLVSVRLFNPAGQIVAEMSGVTIDTGTNLIHLDIRLLKTGVYLLKVDAGETCFSEKLVIGNHP